MTDIINFNKARKAKLKQAKAKEAAENRIRFGISAKARKVDQLQRDQQAARLDGHRLTTTVENQKSVDEEQ